MKKSQILRYISLLFFLFIMTFLGYYHQKVGGGISGATPVNTMTPLGGLESLYSYIKDGTWLRKLTPSSLILFVSVGLMTIALGRGFCGWVCPMGGLTEIFSHIGTKLKIVKRKLPYFLDKILRPVKYILLVLIISLTWQAGTMIFSDYDPWVAYMHLTTIGSGLSYGLLILIFVLVLELFVSRFWCKYLCPLGACLAILGFFSPVKIRRSIETCINCQNCDKVCPVDIVISKKQTVGYGECISCGLCTEACPESNTLNFALKKRKFIISALSIGIITIIIFGTFYSVSKMTGLWHITIPVSFVQSANPVDGIFADMNIRQVAETVGLPVKKLIEIVGLDNNIDLDMAIKSNPKINNELLRERLFLYFQNNPIENHESPYIN